MYIIENKISPSTQRGVGMVEVMVSILLLAIGVLGYSALQVRAVSATAEAFKRSQAMELLGGFAEEIRANTVGQTNAAGQNSYSAVNNSTLTSIYNSTTPTKPASCDNVVFNSYCTFDAFASWDAYNTALAASALGMQINVLTCPGDVGTNPRQCLFGAWGTTQPTIGSNATDCMLETGTYNPVATCLMMETY